MRCALVILAVAAAAAYTQDSQLPERTELLARIRQRAREDLAAIPNYVCIDSIERYQRVPGERAFRRLDRVHLELAHIEGTDRFSWLGNSAFQAETPSGILGYGASIGGDFASNRALVFGSPSARIRYTGLETIDGRPAARYQYEVPLAGGGLRMTIGSSSGTAAARGSFWADPETLDVLRVDMEAYDIPRGLPVQSMGNRTMYWRVLIGERRVLQARNSEFWLADPDGTVMRNVSVFSSCREFSAQSSVSFGPGAAEIPAPPGLESTRLPADLELKLVLDTPLDPDKAATGDSVRAHVAEQAGEVPKGAPVYGRVNRIIRYNSQRPSLEPRRKSRSTRPQDPRAVWYEHVDEVLIGLEFSHIEYRGHRAPFLARLIEVEPRTGKRGPQIRSFGYFGDTASVRYDPPGAATLYVSAEDPVLRRGLTMRWLTVASRSGS